MLSFISICPDAVFISDKTYSPWSRLSNTISPFEADADYVGALNIKARADDTEILDVCEKYKYNHDEMQKHIKMVYYARNEKYKAAGEAVQQSEGSGSRDAA